MPSAYFILTSSCSNILNSAPIHWEHTGASADRHASSSRPAISYTLFFYLHTRLHFCPPLHVIQIQINPITSLVLPFIITPAFPTCLLLHFDFCAKLLTPELVITKFSKEEFLLWKRLALETTGSRHLLTFQTNIQVPQVVALLWLLKCRRRFEAT